MATTVAPTGTVTFLFTDIEGSTRMWDQYSDAMSAGLSMLNDLLQRPSMSNSGYMFSRAGAGRNGHMDRSAGGMYRCIGIWRARGNRRQVWTAICNLVEVDHERGHDIEALTLNAAVEADDDRAPKLFGSFRAHYFSFLTDIGEALEPDEASEARRVGSCLDHPAAATFALDAPKRAIETADHRPDGVWPIDP